jgi:hypothetical protein
MFGLISVVLLRAAAGEDAFNRAAAATGQLQQWHESQSLQQSLQHHHLRCHRGDAGSSRGGGLQQGSCGSGMSPNHCSSVTLVHANVVLRAAAGGHALLL